MYEDSREENIYNLIPRDPIEKEKSIRWDYNYIQTDTVSLPSVLALIIDTIETNFSWAKCTTTYLFRWLYST